MVSHIQDEQGNTLSQPYNFAFKTGKAHTSTTDKSAKVVAKPVKDSVSITTTTTIEQKDSQNILINTQDSKVENDLKANIDKPLFKGEQFLGIVKAVTQENGKIAVKTEDAQKIEEVYDEFNLSIANKDVADQPLGRSLQTGSIGRYDHLNAKPLTYSIKTVKSISRSNQPIKELVMQIDIPKGYKVPLSRAIKADYADTHKNEIDKIINVDLSYDITDSITFDTEGTYIRVRVNLESLVFYYKKLLVKNDYGRRSRVVFSVNAISSLESNLEAKLDVDLSKEFEKEYLIKLLKDKYLPIPVGYAHGKNIS